MEKTERRLTVALGTLDMKREEFVIFWSANDTETVARVLQLLLTAREKEARADDSSEE